MILSIVLEILLIKLAMKNPKIVSYQMIDNGLNLNKCLLGHQLLSITSLTEEIQKVKIFSMQSAPVSLDQSGFVKDLMSMRS